jgi:beta-lactamase regulating signal transducer with metallopeptidase domain/peroxiredoxin
MPLEQFQELHQALAVWAQWFWPLLLNHLWQATLFAAVVALAAKLLKNRSAQARHFVWWLAMLKFLLPSALLIWAAQKIGMSFFWQPAPGPDAVGAARLLRFVKLIPPNAGNEPLGADTHPELHCALTLLWLLGFSVLLLRGVWQRLRFARALRAGRVATTERELAALRRVRAGLRVQRNLSLLVSAQVKEPGLWRIWRPVVILPKGLSTRLSESELDAVLTHEVMHYLRQDNSLSLLQLLLCGVFWFHPLIWWLDRRLLAEREFACDEGVITSGKSPQVYAASLWKVAQFGMGWAIAGAARATGSNLPRRIQVMLTTNRPTNLSLKNRVAVPFTVALLLMCAAALTFFTRQEVSAQAPSAANNSAEVVAATAPAAEATTEEMVALLKPADFARLKNEAKGKVLVVNFWATWCPPCLKEIPEFVRLDREYRARGVQVVAISTDEKANLQNAVVPFLKKQNAQFPAFLVEAATPQELTDAVDKGWSGNLPATFVFDKTGKVVLAKHGVIQRAELMKKVTGALK